MYYHKDYGEQGQYRYFRHIYLYMIEINRERERGRERGGT